MRGQIFSIDFVIAMAIISLSIGITLQTLDAMQKRALAIEESYTYNPDSIAQNILFPSQGFSNSTSYCYQFSNGSGNCNGFKCPGSIFAATRLTGCNNGAITAACSLSVKTCE
jgi:hypothetical protein